MGELGKLVIQLGEQTSEIELERRIHTTKIELIILETALQTKREQAIRFFWRRNLILELQAYLKSKGIEATASEISAAMTKIIEVKS